MMVLNGQRIAASHKVTAETNHKKKQLLSVSMCVCVCMFVWVHLASSLFTGNRVSDVC